MFSTLTKYTVVKKILCLQHITPHNNSKFTTNGYYFFLNSFTLLLSKELSIGEEAAMKDCVNSVVPSPTLCITPLALQTMRKSPLCLGAIISIQMKPRPKHHRQKIKTTLKPL